MMGRDYAVDMIKMVKMAKKGDRSAQLLLALTDTNRVSCAISPEHTPEICKQEILNMLISSTGGSADMAKLQMRNIIERLTTVAGWLDTTYEPFHKQEALLVPNPAETTTKEEPVDDEAIDQEKTEDLVDRLAKIIVDEILPIVKEKSAENPTET
jgi:hypothetical protein